MSSTRLSLPPNHHPQASQGLLPQSSTAADAAQQQQQGNASDMAGEEGAAATNNKSNFAFVRRLLPGIPKYVESEWSFAQVRGLESTTICAFGQDPRTLIVVSADGSYLLSSFAEPGECERVSYARFIRSAEEVS